MDDLKAAAWMVRYGARSLAHNLEFIPEDRLDWKAAPEAKSPRDIVLRAVRALGMYRPIFDGPDYPKHRPLPPEAKTREEVIHLLLETAEDYASALDRAGNELDRPQDMPFGATFHASRAVCFPLMDLFNHHGQILFIQSLLGDKEMHWNEVAINDLFAWHETA
jgi:hypothetical protein